MLLALQFHAACMADKLCLLVCMGAVGAVLQQQVEECY